MHQFVAPLLQLCGDGLNAGGLFDGSGFDTSSVVIVKLVSRPIRSAVLEGVVIEMFAILFEHFDGGANLGCGWCLHNQMWIAREGLCREFLPMSWAAFVNATVPASPLPN